MKQFKPKNHYDHLPVQHKWHLEKWDQQHGIPPEAKNQWFDFGTRTLGFTVNGIEQEIPVYTPPPWVKKRLKE